jgi:hypothetical protein
MNTAGACQKRVLSETASPMTAASRPSGVTYHANTRNAIASCTDKRPPASRKK